MITKSLPGYLMRCKLTSRTCLIAQKLLSSYIYHALHVSFLRTTSITAHPSLTAGDTFSLLSLDVRQYQIRGGLCGQRRE